jgi:branched-chain amino acid transport system permease protein
MLVSALFALVTGAVCLRTKGVYFIMITMAFAQMAYYFFLSLEEYGGDDGLTIYNRSILNIIDIENKVVLFLLAYAVLVAGIYAVYRIVNSRFGMVVRGCQSNEARMKALGYNTYAYRLTAYVIAGTMCGLAGALLGNFQSFISPDMMGWTRSGELMFMVILGGTGTLFGPVFGAVAFLVIEEILSAFTTYWALPFGILLILSVLFIKGGLSGLIHRGLRHG